MFTILVPCYNESATIGAVIENLIAEFGGHNIIVINNNSNDGSEEIIASYPVTTIHESVKGKANAIRAAISYVKTPYVVLQDADLEYPVSELRALTAASDLALNTMIVGKRPTDAMLLRSRLANWLISTILRLRFKESVTDCLSGMRMVPTFILERTRSSGFELETELNKLCLQNNVVINETPISYAPRLVGKKIRFWDIFKLVKMAVTK